MVLSSLFYFGLLFIFPGFFFFTAELFLECFMEEGGGSHRVKAEGIRYEKRRKC